jgi:hypothetical protein
MTPNGLGLETASATQGFDLIPDGAQVALEMAIRPGNGIGIEGLEKRTSKGDATYLDTVFTVKGGEYNGRKIYANMLLDGTTAGHAKAGEISRQTLRAIFEAAHGIDPNDNSAATVARRASASLSGFNGATFLATVSIEKGGKRPDGSGTFKDKNTLGRVLRVGDYGYRRLDQPPPTPIAHPAPPTAPHGSPGAVVGTISKPAWAE